MSTDGATVRGLSDQVLKCRGGYNHSWDDCPPPINHMDLHNKRDLKGWRMWLTCSRCTAVRLDVVNVRTGELEARRYWHPDGYRIETDTDGRLPRRVVYRRELWRRNNGR